MIKNVLENTIKLINGLIESEELRCFEIYSNDLKMYYMGKIDALKELNNILKQSLEEIT